MVIALQNVAYIGELVVALVVIASLVYLAIQIKRSDSTARAATTQALLSRSIDMLLSQNNHSPLTKFEYGQPLSSAEQLKLEQIYFARLSHFNGAHHQHKVGELDPQIWGM